MNKERLLKIVDHLKNGKLGHEEFDFRIINCGASETNHCGTSGCAFGEFPIIFPEDWHFINVIKGSTNYIPFLKSSFNPISIVDAWEDLETYLDITKYESSLLFISDNIGIIGKITLPSLSDYATKEEVADNILEFIRLKELNKNNERI